MHSSELRDKFLSAYPAANSLDYMAMVQDETENEMRESKRRNTASNWAACQNIAQTRIQKWADESEEFAIGGNFTLSGFVATRRRACVWAVLIGREAAGESLRPAPMEAE